MLSDSNGESCGQHTNIKTNFQVHQWLSLNTENHILVEAPAWEPVHKGSECHGPAPFHPVLSLDFQVGKQCQQLPFFPTAGMKPAPSQLHPSHLKLQKKMDVNLAMSI